MFLFTFSVTGVYIPRVFAKITEAVCLYQHVQDDEKIMEETEKKIVTAMPPLSHGSTNSGR